MSLVQNLEIKVNSIQFVDDEKVHIRFQGIDHKREINLNGYVIASQEEYLQNVSREKMSGLVKEKIIERIEKDPEEEGAAEE
ncbi:hypothetical protein [Alteribacter populi]|uniref:hypothetical protein n=1 Tax=Alteribacter populi TaxID=2011011 RepID=UPI000BBB5CBA|nr:hypothetical protein [Alteribacter populi]